MKARWFRRSVIAAALPLGLSVLAWPVPDAAAKQSCKLQIRDLNRIEASEDYDPYRGPRIDYHQFRVEHLNGPGCQFMVVADDGENGPRRMVRKGEFLDYELYTSADLSQPLADEGGPLSATFVGYVDDDDDEVQFTLFSVIPPGQLVPEGDYRDRIRFEAYELEDGVPTRFLDSQNTQVRADVEEVVRAVIYIAGAPRLLSGTVGTVDLGELTGGGRGMFELEVSGNEEFDLYLSSENGGQLQGPKDGPGIPYRISVDGRTLDLRSPRNLTLDGDGERRYSLEVWSEEVSQAIAGTYRDNLYLSVEAR